MNGPAADTRTHAVLMDRIYRHQRHIYDLTRKFYLFGRDRLIRGMQAKPGECAIEIGCGTARNLICAAQAYPGTRFYGLDASLEMLHTAEKAIGRAGLSDRIGLVHAMAEDVNPALAGLRQPFDHAVFSYSLSMIPDWRGALAAASGAVRPAGAVHVVDFGDLAALWPQAADALRAWLRLFHVTPRHELLKSLETNTSNQRDTSLHILPGRYAFVLKTPPGTVAQLGSHPVAS